MKQKNAATKKVEEQYEKMRDIVTEEYCELRASLDLEFKEKISCLEEQKKEEQDKIFADLEREREEEEAKIEEEAALIFEKERGLRERGVEKRQKDNDIMLDKRDVNLIANLPVKELDVIFERIMKENMSLKNQNEERQREIVRSNQMMKNMEENIKRLETRLLRRIEKKELKENKCNEVESVINLLMTESESKSGKRRGDLLGLETRPIQVQFRQSKSTERGKEETIDNFEEVSSLSNTGKKRKKEQPISGITDTRKDPEDEGSRLQVE